MIVPPAVKLRHAKFVVVSSQYSRKKTVSGMHSSRYRIVRVWYFFPREDSLEKYRRCALLLLWSFAGQVHAVVCWYVTDKYVCVASYLTCFLLLIAD